MLFRLKNTSWPYTANMSSYSSLHHTSQSAIHFPPFHHFPPILQSESEICSVESNSLQPHGLYSLWNSPGQNTGVDSLSLLGFPNPGLQPRSPALWANSLPAEPQGKPKNNGVGSLSLLHHIFPTQESNQGLLHCRWILYQLSYHGSPSCYIMISIF